MITPDLNKVVLAISIIIAVAAFTVSVYYTVRISSRQSRIRYLEKTINRLKSEISALDSRLHEENKKIVTLLRVLKDCRREAGIVEGILQTGDHLQDEPR